MKIDKQSGFKQIIKELIAKIKTTAILKIMINILLIRLEMIVISYFLKDYK